MGIAQKRRQAANRALLKSSPVFQEIDMEEREHPDWMTRAFSNNRYIVMIMDNAPTTHGPAIRAMVQKHDDTPILSHWSEMQNIKNKIFGTECVAVEYYPAESQLENSHNIYWMWVFPPGILPIALKR